MGVTTPTRNRHFFVGTNTFPYVFDSPWGLPLYTNVYIEKRGEREYSTIAPPSPPPALTHLPHVMKKSLWQCPFFNSVAPEVVFWTSQKYDLCSCTGSKVCGVG